MILIWRHGASLMRRLITIGLHIIDQAQARPSLRLFDHSLEIVCGWAANYRLEMVDSQTVSPCFG